MGRPTNAEIAAKKATEEEKRKADALAAEEKAKADALAQKITGAEESESDSASNANPEVTQDDGAEVPIDLPKDEPDPVAEPVEDMPESNITAPTFEAEYVIYDHMVKAHGKFYAAGKKVPVH